LSIPFVMAAMKLIDGKRWEIRDIHQVIR